MKAQLAYLEDLYVLINDGIPANRAVEMMAQVTTGITHDVSETLTNKIAQGQPLAEGMKEWFAPNVVEIIRVGETGGALGQTLQSAISMLSQQGVAMSAFFGAVTYPLVVLMVGCLVVVYIDYSVFPAFEVVKPRSQWPDAGRQLATLAMLIKYWWWLLFLIIAAIVMVFRKLFSSYVGEFRPNLDKYPPFSLYRRLICARVLETLGLLVANGVVFKASLKVMQNAANPYTLWHLQKMEDLLSKGKSNIGDVLDTGLVTRQDLMRLRVMAEVKGFEHGLVRMGVKGTEDATASLKSISRALGMFFLILSCFLIVAIIRGIFITAQSLAN